MDELSLIFQMEDKMSIIFGIIGPRERDLAPNLLSKTIDQANMHGKRHIEIHSERAFCFGYPRFDALNRFATCDDGRYFFLWGGRRSASRTLLIE